MHRSAGSSRAGWGARAAAFQDCTSTWSRRPSGYRHDGRARRACASSRSPVTSRGRTAPSCSPISVPRSPRSSRRPATRCVDWGPFPGGVEGSRQVRDVRVPQRRKVRGDNRSRCRRIGVAFSHRQADLLVDGMPPGALDGFGLDVPALEALRPGLVVVRISPFGQHGPLRDRQVDAADRAGGFGLGQPARSRSAAGAGRGDGSPSTSQVVTPLWVRSPR